VSPSPYSYIAYKRYISQENCVGTPILWESGVGSDVMKPIAAPIVGGMITSTIHVLILVPVFFLLIKRRELRRCEVQPAQATRG